MILQGLQNIVDKYLQTEQRNFCVLYFLVFNYPKQYCIALGSGYIGGLRMIYISCKKNKKEWKATANTFLKTFPKLI